MLQRFEMGDDMSLVTNTRIDRREIIHRLAQEIAEFASAGEIDVSELAQILDDGLCGYADTQGRVCVTIDPTRAVSRTYAIDPEVDESLAWDRAQEIAEGW